MTGASRYDTELWAGIPGGGGGVKEQIWSKT